jgi:hypothetical protein
MTLKRCLASLRKDELAVSLAVTLTYPAEFPAPDDNGTYKGHLHVFNQALFRRFGASGVWKLEFQSRGAAHFHLLLFGLSKECLEEVRQWVAAKWFEIVGSGDQKHLRAGTSVEPCKSIGGVMNYMAKYLSKSDQTLPGNFTGRYWGRLNSKALPVCDQSTETLRPGEGPIVARWARTILRKHVETSRWDRALKGSVDVPAHEGWSRILAERALQSPREPIRTAYTWQVKIHGRGVKSGTAVESWHRLQEWNLKERFNPPGRYRPRQNDTVSLIVDADRFMADFLRARSLKLFDRTGPPVRAQAKTDTHRTNAEGSGSRRGPQPFRPQLRALRTASTVLTLSRREMAGEDALRRSP